jgi:hypothetical protein
MNKQNTLISFRRFACGITDPETIAAAQVHAKKLIDARDSAGKKAAVKNTKSNDPKAIKARENMRERRRQGK